MHIENQVPTTTSIVISSQKKTSMITSQASGSQHKTKIKILDRTSILANLISSGREMLVVLDMQTLSRIRTDQSISRREVMAHRDNRAAFMMTAILNNQLVKVRDRTMNISMMSI